MVDAVDAVGAASTRQHVAMLRNSLTQWDNITQLKQLINKHYNAHVSAVFFNFLIMSLK